MASSWNFVFVLVWLSALLGAGIHLFSKGFLLTRIAQTDYSTCIRYEDYRCENDKNFKGSCNSTGKVVSILQNVNVSANICLPPKSKVILLVIDALRYDFGTFDASLEHPLPYQNKLPVLTELLNRFPDHTRKLKFVADPPTTTLQRLKAMTTGSLPTFIDIGSNFASPEINEDNVVDQWVRANRSAVFLGDNTWTELFPRRFKRKYDYPSFNIHDLDSVDRAIKGVLPKEIAKKDWDVIVAHFLGIDHCGHRYGPLHGEMERKLMEMNDVIRNVTDQMDDETTLIVIGDHGMTQTGDHGGESAEEVNALFFMYSKGTQLLPEEYDEFRKTMQQIDLVPLLSALLGVPIPHSNLGQINFQLLPDVKIDSFLRYQPALLHLWQNARQIQKYFQQYADTNRGTFTLDHIDDLENKFLILTQRVNTVYTEAAFQSFSKDLRLYLKDILDSCRDIWVKFDPQLISHGLLVTFLSCFGIFLLICNSNAYQLGQIFNGTAVYYIVVLSFMAGTSGFFFHQDFGLSSAEHGTLFFASIASIAVLFFLIIKNWPSITDSISQYQHSKNFVTRISFTFTTCVFFSNSFIVEEQKILSYVLIGFFLLALYNVHKNSQFKVSRFRWATMRKSAFFKLLALALFAITLVRISSSYFRCREEQGNCTDYIVKAPTPDARRKTGPEFDLVPVIALSLYVICARLYLRACGNLTGNAMSVMLARYGPSVGAVCACGHFVLANSNTRGIPQIHVDALAWVVYVMLLIQIVTIVVRPLMVFVLPKKKDMINILYSDRNVAPEIYRQLKDNYNSKNPLPPNEVPIVCGLATVYSSVFIGLGIILTILLSLLLGSNGTTGLVISLVITVSYGIIASILQYENSNNLLTCLQPTFGSLLFWIISSQFGFYATSHQPTMSQIDWNAAFIGRTWRYDNNNVISAILVLLNTFSLNFLLSVLFPLILLTPFCVYTMWPSLAQKTYQKSTTTGGGSGSNGAKRGPKSARKVDGGSVEYRSVTVNKVEDGVDEAAAAGGSVGKEIDFDVTKGEINLYENEKLFIGTAFKTACQLVLIQGIRIFCAMFACTLHCRHLMVWKIFAPRFIYEGIGSYIAFIGLNLGFLVLLRVHRAVNTLITRINKDR
ncbi:GPI ethanolamine phosphate transferase 3 [Toxorhynchites rutilus septentrionalis]|uniref:GPI ethanolamine phosphate transferase 3 n=1 Tax=Toxorhynchites rutilus septentrionalis TaxID=329112 RepID=UPI002478941F|nr:GPI ethanolamine phosphate transferase 3 [Toxorhynchites rutilus septentrionalis]